MNNTAPSIIKPGDLSGALASAKQHGGSGVNLYEASAQWRSRPADQRFETLDALAAAVGARRTSSRSVDAKLNDVNISAFGEEGLIIDVDGSSTSLKPSHWSFGQFCSRVGAPAGYLRSLPNGLAAQNLQHSIRSADQEALKLLTVEDASEGSTSDNLQAVTSTSYGRIWDADVVEAVQRIVEKSGGKFFNPKDWSGKPSGLYASDHDVFAFMIDGGSIVDGGGERDQLHRGFFISNSETGAKAFSLQTFLFRVACGNHIVWHAEDIKKFTLIHSQGAPGRFDREAYGKLSEFVNASAKPIEDQIKRAKNARLTYTEGKKGAEGLMEFGLKHGFTRPEIRGAYAHAIEEEKECWNLWDFCNGLTAHARGYEFVDARVDLENRAGKLLALAAN